MNIEEERTIKSQSAAVLSPDRKTASYVNPELKLNLYILVSSNYLAEGNYITGLKYLSNVIHYFQGNNVFDRKTTPTLDQGVQKLVVELQTQNFEQMNHLWAGLGAKYLPSVLYKVRMLIVQEGRKKGEGPAISTVTTSDRSI